jgi:ADP-ribose pyrophosphatase
MEPPRTRRLWSRVAGRFAIFSVLEHELSPLPPRPPQRVITLELRDWVVVAALTRDGRFILVRQHRHGIDAPTLEPAGGVIDPPEPPHEAALRELREETGFLAGRLESLGMVHPNPAIQENRCHLFLALDCDDGGVLDLDLHEDTEPSLWTPAEVRGELDRGGITHALAVIALERALARLEGRRAPCPA